MKSEFIFSALIRMSSGLYFYLPHGLKGRRKNWSWWGFLKTLTWKKMAALSGTNQEVTTTKKVLGFDPERSGWSKPGSSSWLQKPSRFGSPSSLNKPSWVKADSRPVSPQPDWDYRCVGTRYLLCEIWPCSAPGGGGGVDPHTNAVAPLWSQHFSEKSI